MGVSVLFFPEGTRSHDGVVKPFKPGAFKLALEAGCDVLPLAINGTLNALPKGTWLFGNERVKMRILAGEPISTRGMTDDDLERLMAMSRDAVVALKDELDGKPAAAPAQAARRAVG
jgi:1-acyl-sn-glycerol-3-phosphate acyltransferase